MSSPPDPHETIEEIQKEESEYNDSISETELVRKFIEENQRFDNFQIEVPYQHYGNRGYVDLFTLYKGTHTAYEFKSNAAIEQATGANEIIRQFKKQIEYFQKGFDGDLKQRISDLQHNLVFVMSRRSLKHLYDNEILYSDLDGLVELYSPDDNCKYPILGNQAPGFNQEAHPPDMTFAENFAMIMPEAYSNLHLTVESIDDKL